MALQVYQPEEMRRIGGGRGGDEFAGLGGSFAGPSSRFVGEYLQNRLSGMNRATVSPRVNQRRVMASPEFALAKTLGISTPYNSGGSQVDIQGARQRLNSPSAMERDAAQSQLDKFDKRAAQTPLNPVLEGAGFSRVKPQEYAEPDNQGAANAVQEMFGAGKVERKQEIPQTRPTEGGGSPAPTPTIPATGSSTAQGSNPRAGYASFTTPEGKTETIYNQQPTKATQSAEQQDMDAAKKKKPIAQSAFGFGRRVA